MNAFRLMVLLGLLAASLPASASGAAREFYKITPEPDWATPLTFEAPDATPLDQVSNGLDGFHWEEFHRTATAEIYGQYGRKILNEAGVQHGSEIHIYIDPDYETLDLHKVDVLRDGKWVLRLTPEIISVLQRENEMENYVVNGTRTVVIRLPDVREGDVIWYSFTRRGANPVMDGHYHLSLSLASSRPRQILRYRVQADPARPLTMRNHDTEVEPTKEGDVFEWRLGPVNGMIVEDDVPVWQNVYPWVEMSDMKDWASVVAWGAPLYDFNAELPAELTALIEEFRAAGGPVEQAAAALRFVQDEIRYQGMHDGMYSHRPRSPAEVCERRFGDCKEKVQLLGAMLSRLGIESWPVLVNTDWERGISNFLPSPYAFDHVISEITIDGKTYIVDPTRAHQRGPLAKLYLPPYSLGLRLKSGETALMEIPFVAESVGKQVVHERVQMPDHENNTPGTLVIESTATGIAAEDSRERFATKNLAELREEYLNFYASTYPEIESAAPIEFSDDPKTNTFKWKESYILPALWEEDDDDADKVTAVIYQKDLANCLGWPGKTKRRWDYALIWPMVFEIRTDVEFPAGRRSVAFDEKVENPWFRFFYKGSGSGKNIRFDGGFEATARSVPADKIAQYRKQVTKADDLIGYVFNENKNAHKERSGMLDQLKRILDGSSD